MSHTLEFIKNDFKSTLFPLKSNILLFEVHEDEIKDYILNSILKPEIKNSSFLPQKRVYSTKPKGHLRRTTKLDPIAEYFIYDLVYRNRSIFRKEVSENRRSFGYRFREGRTIPVHESYNEYKQSLIECKNKFKHRLKFDIASYFNSIYLHDLSNWFANQDVSETDSQSFNQFFREINAGRSIDFLPQGIYPCKMIGSEFIKFVDTFGELNSSKVIRFMDDFTLFDDDMDTINSDFVRIQKILGNYALNINPSKTLYDDTTNDVENHLSVIGSSLNNIVTKIEFISDASGVEVVEYDDYETDSLSEEQILELISLLKSENIEESDADIILGFMRNHADEFLEVLPSLLKFPNLIKHIHTICSEVSNTEELSVILLNFLESKDNFLEYQLFWIATIFEDYLHDDSLYGKGLMRIYTLSEKYIIARAKVLEVSEQGYGLKQLRGEYLQSGQSDWLSWASAIGSRELRKAERNHVLDYFSKCSAMNSLIASAVKKM